MVKKLKLKFIITNMVLVTIVMLACYVLIYAQAMKDIEKECKTAMHEIADSDNRFNYLFDPENKRLSKYGYLSTYIIETDDVSGIYYIDGFGDVDSLTDEEKKHISALINAVNAMPNNEGILEKYNMRYYYKPTLFGKKIVLLDKSYEDDNSKRLISLFILTGIIGLGAFFGISLLVSSIAIKPIERSMKQQKQLISDVSHELKTPISVISTNTDIVMSHSDSIVSDEQKWLGYIKDETERMSELLNMMLYLAKSDEGIVMDIKDTNISDASYEASLPFESVCFESGKEFIIDVEPDIYVKCNKQSIKQLIGILLDNAIKYSNDNGKIIFSLKRDQDKAVMSVFNTGDPIPKEEIPYLFDRFYRVDESRSRDKGGNGLGLSIAKKIIENNEGSISVISNEENGTTFFCTFKLSKKSKKQKESETMQFN